MSKPRNVTRATIVRWLTEQPGLTNREIALRARWLPSYAAERMRQLEEAGFVRRAVLPDTASRRELICWFVAENHPPLGRKTRPALPKPREHLVRKPEAAPRGCAQQLVRVCRAPDHDSSIVAQALAAAPALQAAWMGRAQA